MQRMDRDRFEATRAEYDDAVAADAAIDRFCSRSAWILSFHAAFHPDAEVVLARDAGAFVALARVHEPGIGLRGTLVVDNVACGPAIGGLRMAPDVSTQECFRLARAMTFKNAAATGGDKTYGDNLAAYFVKNADKLGVMYVIWYRQIWMPSTGWRAYSASGGPAAVHTNHVHLSML